MDERAHRRVQGADHLPIAYVDADVRPVVGAVGVLDHDVSRLGICGFNHRHPLLGARQADTSLGIGPLDKTGTVPSVVKAGATPNIRVAQALVGGGENVFAHLGDKLRGEFRDGSPHCIHGAGKVGRVAIRVCQIKSVRQINNLFCCRLLGLDQGIGEGQLHPDSLGGKGLESGWRSLCASGGNPYAFLKTERRGVGHGGVGISGCNKPPRGEQRADHRHAQLVGP